MDMMRCTKLPKIGGMEEGVKGSTEVSTSSDTSHELLTPSDYTTAWIQEFLSSSGSFDRRKDSLKDIVEEIRKRYADECPHQVRVLTSFEDFLQLQSKQDLDSSRYPRVSYDTATKKASIDIMPSEVQEAVSSAFSTIFHHVSARMNSSTIKLYIRGSPRRLMSRGIYRGSRKEPDFIVSAVREKDVKKVLLVLEVGFRQEREELAGDMRLWLEGTDDLRRAILVDITEKPQYNSPIRALSDEQLRARSLEGSQAVSQSMVEEVIQGNEFGPLSIGGVCWVGEMTATLEVWDHHPTTGKARQRGLQKTFIGPSVGVDNLPTPVSLRLSDLDPQITGADDQNIDIPWELFRENLRWAWQELALDRCQTALEARFRQ